MITISLCMIVKDEEDVIERCLYSAKGIADEIIVVDTGSTDGTKDIVKKFTAKVYDFRWIDDFSAARNYSFSKATKDYILWMDADDIILEEDKLKIKQLKLILDKSVDMVMMKYNVGFDANDKVNFSYFRERLLKRSNNYKWQDPVHEFIQTEGNIINSDAAITHKKIHAAPQGRNIKIYEKMISEGKTLTPRNLYYYARELYYNGRYKDAVENFYRFLNTGKGWIEDNISACYDLSMCYQMLEERNNIPKVLLKSFEYDEPRAEICCQMGYYYMSEGDYEKAASWYELATKLKKKEENWGFVLHDYWGYIPWIQLCVCYYNMGEYNKAKMCNERAGEFKPEDPSVQYNKKLFEASQ